MVAQRTPLPPGDVLRGGRGLRTGAGIALCAAMFLGLGAGCGGPELAPVSGKITVSNQPATRGTVSSETCTTTSTR